MALARLFEAGCVLAHPFVIGELASGSLRQRHVILDALHDLPPAAVASGREVFSFIGQQSLFGLGIGYVDVHLQPGRSTAGVSMSWGDKT